MVIGLPGTPSSAVLHVHEYEVLNGTNGVGASEQLHMPINQNVETQASGMLLDKLSKLYAKYF